MTTTRPSDWANRDQIVRRAEALTKAVRRSSPAQRAALRRGVGRPPEHVLARTAHAMVEPFLPEGRDRATEWAFYAIASLIAAQTRQARDAELEPKIVEEPANEPSAVEISETPEPVLPPERQRVNLGQTLADAVLTGEPAEKTTEARLHLLCRQDLPGLHRHLARLITHLRAGLVPVDWAVLADDLSRWERERDWVAKEWLQAFHRTLAASRARPSTINESEQP